MTKPCFSIIGSKSNMSSFIVDRMPNHKCFVEVFGGSASVLLAKKPSKVEVYNDKNELLTNFFEVLRSKCDEFIEQYDFLVYNEILNKRWKKEPWPADPMEKAIRFWYCIVTSFNGQMDSSFSYNGPDYHKQTTSFRNKKNILKAVAQRMRNVYVMCRDFEDIINIYDGKDTLFFLDPPYYDKEDYYNYNGDIFTKKDHKRLKKMLSDIKGNAMVTYYGEGDIEGLYSDWRLEKWETTKSSIHVDNRTEENFKAIESMYCNFKTHEQLNLLNGIV